MPECVVTDLHDSGSPCSPCAHARSLAPRGGSVTGVAMKVDRPDGVAAANGAGEGRFASTPCIRRYRALVVATIERPCNHGR